MCSNPINQDGSNLPLSNWAGLVRADLVRADSVGAGSEPAPTAAIHENPEPATMYSNPINQDGSNLPLSNWVGLVRAGLVRADLIRANPVGAGSEPAPTAAIHAYPEPATMCSNPINQDGSNLPLSNWAGLVRVDSVGAGSEPAPTAVIDDYLEPAHTVVIRNYPEPAPTAAIHEYPKPAHTVVIRDYPEPAPTVKIRDYLEPALRPPT